GDETRAATGTGGSGSNSSGAISTSSSSSASKSSGTNSSMSPISREFRIATRQGAATINMNRIAIAIPATDHLNESHAARSYGAANDSQDTTQRVPIQDRFSTRNQTVNPLRKRRSPASAGLLSKD